ncbi:hypothetical protein PENSPDRAFT_655965 [Peniophora sp. CONT]|nr:hypothetical protein PENSPDRAFT_655965 [Peniophora sp. CONT]
MKLARLSTVAGAAHSNAFVHLGNKNAKAKKEFERMARAPRNQLLDMLFPLFAERPTWGSVRVRSSLKVI